MSVDRGVLATHRKAPRVTKQEGAHDHDHGAKEGDHDHAGHSHGPPPAGSGRIFAISTGLNITFVVVEVVYGLAANSTALLADAAHNASDVVGLLLAWAASALATRAPSARRTYGFKSTTILAAFLNAMLILVAVGGVAWEAIQRARSPVAVEGGTVAIVALIGVGVNASAAALFMRGRKGDVNMGAAFSHLLADALVSVGVVIAGILIVVTGATWIDPLTSIGVSVVILIGTIGLVRETSNLVIAGVPSKIDITKVTEFLAKQQGVTEVHDLHVWPMSTTEVALTVHLIVPGLATPPGFLASLAKQLEHRFGIHHVTVQLEDASVDCAQAPAEVV